MEFKDAHNLIINNVSRFIELTDEEKHQFISLLKEIKIKKNGCEALTTGLVRLRYVQIPQNIAVKSVKAPMANPYARIPVPS